MKLLEALAPGMGLSQHLDTAREAARLGRADLGSAMVTELTALAGTMGRIYAQHSGEPTVHSCIWRHRPQAACHMRVWGSKCQADCGHVQGLQPVALRLVNLGQASAAAACRYAEDTCWVQA